MKAGLPIRILVAVLALALGLFGLIRNDHFASDTAPSAVIVAGSQDGQHHAPESASAHATSMLMCTGASCAGILGMPNHHMLHNVRPATYWVASYRLGDGRLLNGPDPFPPKNRHAM